MSDAFPVVIGTCLDAEAIWTGRDASNADRRVMLSHGTFAIKEGLAPLLDLFDTHGLKSTFFIPGQTADRYPDAVRLVHARGHEIASHGHGHRPTVQLSPQEEKHELVAGIDSLETIIGTRPVTWRSPAWDWSKHTLDLLLENGVTVSTNFHDRLRPYRHERHGKPVDVVELPVQWHLADAPYFMYGGQAERTIRPAIDAQKVWEEEFDALQDCPGAFYHLTLHVQLIGHPGRLKMLDRHLRHIKAQPRAKFMTAQELAAGVA
jgi:peptidoglycan/xylan/chitin deacetylase (PgdA/CDA1 family)